MAIGRPFQPGQSGNPGGRAKGLEKRVRELVDFDKITLALQDIAMGIRPADGPLKDLAIKTRDRIEAAKLLYDRGYGRAKQTVDLKGDVVLGERPVDVRPLTDEELRVAAKLDDGLAEEPSDDGGDATDD